MGLFNKRPLALCSFVFFMSALAAWFINNQIKLVIIIVASVLGGILFGLSFAVKGNRLKVLTLCICILALVTAFIHSFLLIGVPKEKATEYVGKSRVLCYITDEKYSSDSSEIYTVKIKNIDGESTNIRAKLICGFTTELSLGDEIYGVGEISENTSVYDYEKECLLNVYMADKSLCYGRYISTGKNLFDFMRSECGIEIITNKLSDSIKEALYSILGEENGALAMGFFTGERSDVPMYITRDFRRAGVSHIMAVSGSHIAILLGSIELLLRKLSVPKSARIIVVSIFSVLFIVITGFSLSGLRSVLMLYAVYIAYLSAEDNDTVTSLFVSIAVIVLIFPYSVVDLGLWMSFLATLGLLTVYPVIEERIPYPRIKNKLMKRILLIGRYILMTALMTVVANMLLLPIIWYYFGELSTVSVLSNIVVGPLSNVFLVSVPLLLLIYKIPLLGIAAKFFVTFLADAIIDIVGIFSRVPNATLSIKYDICSLIVILFLIAMIILMIVTLKRKLLVMIPYTCATVMLIICSVVWGEFLSEPTMLYTNMNDDELFTLSDGDDISFCDNTLGTVYTYKKVVKALEASTATEIDNYVLTHYHSGSKTAFDLVTQAEIVRTLYLPTPVSNDEISYARQLWDIARERNIDVKFYEDREELDLSKNLRMRTLRSDDHEKGRAIVFFSRNDSITYLTPAFFGGEIKYGRVIVGGHGISGERVYDMRDISADEVYISSETVREYIKITKAENIFIAKEAIVDYTVAFHIKK